MKQFFIMLSLMVVFNQGISAQTQKRNSKYIIDVKSVEGRTIGTLTDISDSSVTILENKYWMFSKPEKVSIPFDSVKKLLVQRKAIAEIAGFTGVILGIPLGAWLVTNTSNRDLGTVVFKLVVIGPVIGGAVGGTVGFFAAKRLTLKNLSEQPGEEIRIKLEPYLAR